MVMATPAVETPEAALPVAAREAAGAALARTGAEAPGSAPS